MPALLDRRLLVVTGKGGVGKTTVAAALGLLAARSGRRTLVVELGQQSRLAGIFGAPEGEPGREVRLSERLSSLTIDPDRALLEWLQALGGRVSGRILASSGTFQYFAAAAPGARELVSMVKVWRLTQGRGTRAQLIVLDAPATGHALGLLRSPHTFGAIARVGPVARHAEQVRGLLEDPARSAYVAVALGTEMAVTETLELRDGLREALGRELEEAILNAGLPRRFQAAELQEVERLARAARAGRDSAQAGRDSTRAGRDSARAGWDSTRAGSRELIEAALGAAREVHERAGFQHAQLARLRRRGLQAIPLPFLWEGVTGPDALEVLAGRLARGLARQA